MSIPRSAEPLPPSGAFLRLEHLTYNYNIDMESEVCVMLKEYDFSNARKNPYAKALKKQITINIDSNTIDYFKEQAEVVGIPYQTLINLYLKDCVANNHHLSLSWQ